MDSVYIKKVLDGSTDDFRYFIRKYKDMAFAVAISVVKNEFDAEDVVQESFLKAFRNLKSFKGKSEFKTWFYRIVINEAFRHNEKTKKDKFVAFEKDLPDTEDYTETFRGIEAGEQHVLVLESLSKIPSKESLALQLFYLDGYSLDEVGNLTGWTVANVKVILHRARKHLLAVVNEQLNETIVPRVQF